jgi:hypothetical protein
MPLDLLLSRAGKFELAHQTVLHILFEQGHLAEELGLPATTKVEREAHSKLFDLELGHGARGSTGVEIKTWSSVGEGQAKRQRAWAKDGQRAIAYLLLGHADLEGVPGQPVRNEKTIGAELLRDATRRLASRADCSSAVRELSDGYSRWLSTHVAERKASLAAEEWDRLAFAVFYSQVKALLSWDASIYPVTNPGGQVYILNFDDDWLPLDDSRVKDAELYWELVDGVPHFKVDLVRKGARAAESIRDELREVILAEAGRLGLPMEPAGRLGGRHMALARSTVDTTTLCKGDRVEEDRIREHLQLCRRVFLSAHKKWLRRA